MRTKGRWNQGMVKKRNASYIFDMDAKTGLL